MEGPLAFDSVAVYVATRDGAVRSLDATHGSGALGGGGAAGVVGVGDGLLVSATRMAPSGGWIRPPATTDGKRPPRSAEASLPSYIRMPSSWPARASPSWTPPPATRAGRPRSAREHGSCRLGAVAAGRRGRRRPEMPRPGHRRRFWSHPTGGALAAPPVSMRMAGSARHHRPALRRLEPAREGRRPLEMEARRRRPNPAGGLRTARPVHEPRGRSLRPPPPQWASRLARRPSLETPLRSAPLRRRRPRGLLREPARGDVPHRLRRPYRPPAGRPQGAGRGAHAADRRGRPRGDGPARARRHRPAARRCGARILDTRNCIAQHSLHEPLFPRRPSGATHNTSSRGVM